MDPAGQSALDEALDRMWNQFLPQIEERLAVLDSAAGAFAAGKLSIEQRQAAHSAAHKLAGVLGSFGLANGTVLARELENIYFFDGGLDPTPSGRLISIAAALRAIIESRE